MANESPILLLAPQTPVAGGWSEEEDARGDRGQRGSATLHVRALVRGGSGGCQCKGIINHTGYTHLNMNQSARNLQIVMGFPCEQSAFLSP